MVSHPLSLKKNPGHCAVATRLMRCLSQWRLTQEDPKRSTEGRMRVRPGVLLSFPSGSAGKNLPVMQKTQETLNSVPGKIPWRGTHGNPLQYSCLENPSDRGAWQAITHRVAKSWTWLKHLSTHWGAPGKRGPPRGDPEGEYVRGGRRGQGACLHDDIPTSVVWTVP